MDMEPSTPPENSQDETPTVDRRTVIKAISAAVGILLVIGSLFLLIQSQYASSDTDEAYRTVADARQFVVDLKTPRPIPPQTFVQHIPLDSRSTRRVEASLADFKGKPVLLAFWASWCRPCRVEMTELDNMLGDLTAAGLAVVPVMTADKSGIDGARFFFRSANIVNLPYYLDRGQSLFEGVGGYALPSLTFIDADGMILAYANELDLRQDAAKGLLFAFARTGRLP